MDSYYSIDSHNLTDKARLIMLALQGLISDVSRVVLEHLVDSISDDDYISASRVCYCISKNPMFAEPCIYAYGRDIKCYMKIYKCPQQELDLLNSHFRNAIRLHYRYRDYLLMSKKQFIKRHFRHEFTGAHIIMLNDTLINAEKDRAELRKFIPGMTNLWLIRKSSEYMAIED